MIEKKDLIVVKEGPLCTLTINNPGKRNALTPDCLFDIAQTFEELSRDDTIRVVILRGAGEEAFSAGADITAMPRRGVSVEVKKDQGDSTTASEAIQKFPFPVIAMLYGYTLGAGCVLAMACDMRIASKNVKMGIPTSRMGLISSQRGFKRFLNVLGYSAALEIFLTGRSYDSQDCLNMGLVNHLVDQDELESYTYKLADEITRCAPLSLRGSKYILSRIADHPVPSAEDIGTFRALQMQAAASDDHEEAKRAFKEKRKPRFIGS
jgi:enoyl-CoA hydratase/carnithine racemase